METVYHIKFPGLNWEFNINPVAFSIGNIHVRWYGVIIAIGFLLALWYGVSQCKKFNMNSNYLIDAILVGLLTGIIGARIYYVLFYPSDFYIKNPLNIFNINEGGIAIYGGIIGGLAGGLAVAKYKKLNIPCTLDLAALGFLIGQGIGRWGNFTNQEAFGTPTNNIFRMISEGTNGIAVHPCFLYESIWCLVGFVLLHFFNNSKLKKYNGQTFLLYLIWYGVERFFVEGLRTDSLIIPGVSIRISQIVALLTIISSIVILIMKGLDNNENNRWKKYFKKNKKSIKN